MKNLKISKKIAVLLGMLLLANIGLTMVLINSMDEINQKSTDIADNWLPSVSLLGKTGNAVSDLRRSELRIMIALLAGDRTMLAGGLKEAEGRTTAAIESVDQYEARIVNEEDRQHFNAIKKEIEIYAVEHKKFMEMVDVKTPAEVKDQLFTVMKPTFDALQQAVLSHVEFNDKGSKTASDEGDRLFAQRQMLAYVGTGLSVIFSFFIIILLTRNVAAPIQQLKEYMGLLQSGDYSQEVPMADRKDEVGEMAGAIQSFRESLIANREMERQQKEETERKLVRQQKVDRLIREFDEKASAAVSSVAAAATELSQTAQDISAAANTASQQTASVSGASKETSNTVQAVAAAAEEMSAAVKEISDQVSRSISIVSEASTETKVVTTTSTEMVNAAKAIGSVAELIEGIASQINLLALNATIESARAGEAGKGFAVVASEVKVLASQTTRATDEIRQKLEGVRSMAENVAIGIQKLDSSVEKVSQVSNSIASAVEEQTAVTQDITRNMNVAARGVEQIDGSIGDIQESAASTSAATAQILGASTMLSKQAEDLNMQVRQFLDEIKAA